MWSPKKNLRECHGYPARYVTIFTVQFAVESLSTLRWNQCPVCRGLAVQFGVEYAGYIRKTEWTAEKGMHFHMIIFYDGQQRQKDTYWTQAIGEYWKLITGGRGYYWNCNDKSNNDYIRYGIGMVEHHDLEKRKILLEDVAKYLTKVEQQVESDYLYY